MSVCSSSEDVVVDGRGTSFFEGCCSYGAQERRLLQEGIEKFPYFDKLYLMLGQLEERAGSPDAARAAYQAGLKRCMGSVPLWRSVARLEEAAGSVGKARALLEQVTHACSPLVPLSLATAWAVKPMH